MLARAIARVQPLVICMDWGIKYRDFATFLGFRRQNIGQREEK